MNLAKSHTTLLTSNTCLDDLGQPWYNYDQQDQIPVGVRFNVRKLENGTETFWIKQADGRTYEYSQLPGAQDQYDTSFQNSQLPKSFIGKDLSSFDPYLYQEEKVAMEALKRAKGFVTHYEAFKNGGRGLFIYSRKEGSGKTYLASAIANEVMTKYREQVKFVNVANFLSQFKRAIPSDKVNPCARSSLFETILRTKLLIIDDLGAGSPSNYASDVLYELISRRAEQDRVTLYTSKRSFKELNYDSSTLNIIQQRSLSIVLPNENVSKQTTKEENTSYEQMLSSGHFIMGRGDAQKRQKDKKDTSLS